jgi:hypothetical protein
MTGNGELGKLSKELGTAHFILSPKLLLETTKEIQRKRQDKKDLGPASNPE